MSEWISNATVSDAVAWFDGRERIALVTHAKPDGDALGSTSALVRTLRTRGVDATAYYCGPMPTWAGEVLEGVPSEHLAGGSLPTGEFDGVVVCDTGSWGQIDPLHDWVRERHDRCLVVDHHLRGDGEMSPLRLIDTKAAAVCEPVAHICAGLLGVGPASLDRATAGALYTGLATDTGWFRFSNVTPETLRLVASLLEAGADAAKIYAMVMQQDRPARLRLMAKAFSSATFEFGGEFVVMRLTAADIHEAKGGPEDTGGFADPALAIASVRAVCVLTEVEGSGGGSGGANGGGALVKASLRSKPGAGMINVSDLAASLGGGGHANAAGVKQRCGMDEAVANILAAYERVRENTA